MADFPNFPSPAKQNEDFGVGVLLEGGIDKIDATTENVNEDASSHLDSSDMLPPHILSTSSTGGDVLKAESPDCFLNLRTAADVVNHYQPKKLASGDLDEVFTDKIAFKYSKRKASAAVKHFIFEENIRPYGDFMDAAKSYGDVADSPTGISSKSTRSRPQVQHCTSVEDEFRYFMEHKQRGCFVIFNVETFDLYNKFNPDEKPLDDRAGSDKDAFNLESAAKSLGFEHVRILHNCTRIEIVQWIYNLSKADHSDYDCFGCAILTHGGNGDILYARDAKMKLTDFTRPFCADVCETLAGKPKLFFIQELVAFVRQNSNRLKCDKVCQHSINCANGSMVSRETVSLAMPQYPSSAHACRGMKLDRGKQIRLRTGPSDAVDGPVPIVDGSSGERSNKLVTIPAEADFLIANSTVPDYYAWRNESNGSWFIQSLCAVFKKYGRQLELMQLMTRVNKMVAYQFKSSSENENYDHMKQIPSIVTRLTAELYFTSKEVPKRQLLTHRAPCSPPSSSVAVADNSKSQEYYDSVDVIKKETFKATTSSTPRLVYASGDFNASPGPIQSETMFFPSPKNISKPGVNITRAPPVSPLKACPRSHFPASLEYSAETSSSHSKYQTGRNLSDNEAYSQSWNTPGMHPSVTVPRGMNLQASSIPRHGAHRCSQPVNRRQEAAASYEEGLRKTVRQTNV